MSSSTSRWNPADYARHSRGQERWARELLALLDLKPHESVLDVGCGDGRITAEIANRVAPGRVAGVDLSEEMVSFAAREFPAERYPNLSFQQADASALPFDSEFDVVYSSAALHWVIQHEPVLEGITRALKPGGRCLLQMGGKGNGAEVVRAFERVLEGPVWRLDLRSFSPYGFHDVPEYRVWLDQAGLTADSVLLVEKDMVHADRAAFTGWLRTAWMPYCNRVPSGRREKLLQQVTDEYLKRRTADAEGRVHVRMMRLQVQAHKANVG